VTRGCLQIATYESRPRKADGCNGGASRRGFSLTELLVVMSIIALLAGLAGAAVSAARTSSKKQQTLQTIAKLDSLVRQQFTSYSSRVIPTPSQPVLQATKTTASQYRAWYIRRNIIAGDLPDRWSDIAVLATGTASVTASGTVRLPITAPQRTYAAVVRESLKKRGNTNPTASEIVAEANRLGTTYSGAECLFLIIMQGGFADCVDCGELKSSPRGDKDGDGAFEFWDAWGNPIGFLLWPAAVELPAGKGVAFFAASGPRRLTPPFNEDMNQNQVLDRATPSCGMVPLIYSAGPDGYTGPNDDGTCGYDCGDLSQANLTLLLSDITPVGRDCGNWMIPPTKLFGAKNGTDTIDYRSDNITNLDLEALIK
jgi:prepilin-type N-terminal cleavage/methylation domain-containing protein